MKSVSQLLAEIDELVRKVEELEDELNQRKEKESECPFAQANCGVCP
jgi:cell division septum initiation protein DivIVA